MRSINVIVIEDNASDAELVRRALLSCGVEPKTHVLASVAEALHFFNHDYVAQRLAELVVVDLNLGDGYGEELLPMIRERIPALAQIVVLTGSFQRAGMERCYQLGAGSCFVKPVRSDELSAIFQNVVRTLPRSTPAPP